MNGVVQHDEILQSITPSNNNIAINNMNNNTNSKNSKFYSLCCIDFHIFPSFSLAHTPIQIQSQSLSAPQQQIIHQQVDQLANVIGNQNATSLNNDLEGISSPALQNDDQQNDIGAPTTTDIDTKEESIDTQNEPSNANNEEVLTSKPASNEPKTYAQFFKSDNFSSNINFASTATTTSGRTQNAPSTLTSTRSTARTNQVRGLYLTHIEMASYYQTIKIYI